MPKFTLNKEWTFLLILGSVCFALLVLQYHWSGALAVAERNQIDLANRKSVENLGKAFDLELQAACESVVTEVAKSSGLSDSEILSIPINPSGKPLFRSLGIVRSEDGSPVLKVWDRNGDGVPNDQLSDHWKPVAEMLIEAPKGPSAPPATSPPSPAPTPSMHSKAFMNDFILEFPPPGFPSTAAKPELSSPVGWLFLELDRDYAMKTWFPKLVEHYLGTNGENRPHLVIRGRSGEIIYGAAAPKGSASPITVPFNERGKSQMWKEGPPSIPVWKLETYWPMGLVEKMESKSRLRNMALGGSAIGLVFLSGLMLSRQAFRLRRISEDRIRFVANVSHEFRTPLTVISGAAYNLKRGIVQNGDETREYASLILDHTEQLGSLVSDVLDFSGLSSRATLARFSEIDVADVLNSAVQDLSGTIEPMTLEIALAGIPSFVHGDPGAIRSIFRNLLDNASKHARSGGWIGVMIDFDSGWVKIEFRDRGPGLSMWDQERVFDPFYRGRTSDRIRGNGLGLSLAREHARAHGGDLTVSSGATGACFTVTLPVMPK